MWLPKENKYARKSLRTRSEATAIEKGKAAYLEIYANLQQGKSYFSITTKKGVEKYLSYRLSESGISAMPVLLNFSETYDVELGIQSAPYTPIDVAARAQYIANVVQHFSYDFDDEPFPDDDELLEMFDVAIARLKAKQKELNFFENINLLFDLPSGNFALINLENGNLKKTVTYTDLPNWHRLNLIQDSFHEH
jgi:hypothetical protein